MGERRNDYAGARRAVFQLRHALHVQRLHNARVPRLRTTIKPGAVGAFIRSAAVRCIETWRTWAQETTPKVAPESDGIVVSNNLIPDFQIPTCDKCGAEITTGFMVFACPGREECAFWEDSWDEETKAMVRDAWAQAA